MECVYADPDQLLAGAGSIVVLIVAIFVLLLLLAVLIIKAVIYCKIFHKAGYCWVLGLLMLVPIACIIVPFVLAFGHWPIQRELEQLRQQQEAASP